MQQLWFKALLQQLAESPKAAEALNVSSCVPCYSATQGALKDGLHRLSGGLLGLFVCATDEWEWLVEEWAMQLLP